MENLMQAPTEQKLRSVRQISGKSLIYSRQIYLLTKEYPKNLFPSSRQRTYGSDSGLLPLSALCPQVQPAPNAQPTCL